MRKVNDKWYLIQDDQHGQKDDRVLAQISDIERWVKGDRNTERAIDISTEDLLHKEAWKGSGAADAIGSVTPRSPANQRSAYTASSPGSAARAVRQHNSNYSGYSGSPGYYLPPVEVIYR